MQKRGQVTLFVIIGILLLFTVTIIFWLTRLSAQERLDAQAQDAVDAFIQANALQHYVTSCLDKVASEGIHLLGRQGGVIYEHQGGLTPSGTDIMSGQFFMPGIHYYPQSFLTIENDALVNKQYNVSYAIRPYVDCPSFSYPRPINLTDEETSHYPVKETFFSNFVSRYSSYYFAEPPGCALLNKKTTWSGFLGMNNLPALCAYNGSNVGTNVCNQLFAFDSSYEPISFERQLVSYVTNKLPSCVDFSIFETLTGNNVTVIDNVSVRVIFQKPRGVLVQATYPFEVFMQGKEPIIKQTNFQRSLPLNLNGVYNYMYLLVRNSLQDPYFSLRDDWNNTLKNPFYAPFYEVYLTPSTLDCDDTTNLVCLDSLLTIVDTSSLVFGKPLTFQFAVRQRKPVLDYLQDATLHSFFQGKRINFQYQIGDLIPLEINPMDPDGDDLFVEIVGWKETYDEYLDTACCANLEGGSCTLNNHVRCLKKIVISDAITRWSESLTFETPSFVASYQTNESDLGLHNVTVIVTDSKGLKDFQIVRILVFDLPVAIITVRNLFSDINNSFASVEDPYILNGSQSTASVLADGDLTAFLFRDVTETILQAAPEGSRSVSIPVAQSTTIQNISLVWFTRAHLGNSLKKIHEIELIVQQGETLVSNPAYKNITVAQCLPHGYTGYTTPQQSFSKDYFATIPYPFHSGSDPYQAAHVCCMPENPFPQTNPQELRGGTYASSGIVCYETTLYTTYPYQHYSILTKAYFDSADGTTQPLLEASYGPSFTSHAYKTMNFRRTPASVFQDFNRVNDIFQIQFQQSCSGHRGNVCGGNIQTTWTPIVCSDAVILPTQFARCQGPPSVGLNVESLAPLTCALYTGASFEKQLYDSFLADSLQSFEPAFRQHFTAPQFTAIQAGYCAGPTPGALQANPPRILAQTNGAFTCMGSCATGSCILSPNQCQCNNNNVCNQFHASDFISGANIISYKCSDNLQACTSTCTISPSNSPASCDCRGGTYLGGGCCESSGTHIFASLTQGCLRDEIFTENAQLISTDAGHTLLCNGRFKVCGTSSISHSFIDSVSSGQQFCSYTCSELGLWFPSVSPTPI